jgi:hypothetical protein
MYLEMRSIPVVGSSSTNKEGLPSRAMATLSLRRMPPLYVEAGAPAAPVSDTCEVPPDECVAKQAWHCSSHCLG